MEMAWNGGWTKWESNEDKDDNICIWNWQQSRNSFLRPYTKFDEARNAEVPRPEVINLSRVSG